MIKFALSLLLAATFSTSIAVAQEDENPSEDLPETAADYLSLSVRIAFEQLVEQRCDCNISNLPKYEKCVKKSGKQALAAFNSSAKFLRVSKEIKQEINLTREELIQGCQELLEGDINDEDPNENLN
jgi:hypothetical protein